MLNSNLGLKLDLLWTNSNPPSSFSSQTIRVNLSNYEGYYVTYKLYASDASNRKVSALVYPKSNIIAPLITYSNPIKIARRDILDVTDSGMKFANCGLLMTGNARETTDNAALIPYQIYGVR